MDYGAYDLPSVSPAENRATMLPVLLQQIMSWEVLINSSMAYVIRIMPLFFIFPTLNFAIEKKSYFSFCQDQFKSFSKCVLYSILQHSLIAAFVSISTFIIFHAIVGLFVTPTLDYITYFGSFLPDSFYANHPLLFIIFMFSTIYFAFAFVCAFTSCGLMLWIKNPYYGIANITAIYHLSFYTGSFLDALLNLNFDLFWLGNTVVAFNTFSTTSQVFIPLIPISLIGIVLVYFGIKKYAKEARRLNIIES